MTKPNTQEKGASQQPPVPVHQRFLQAMHTFSEPFSPPEHSPEPEQKAILHKYSHFRDEFWWIRAKEVRYVRFLLSPPPEPEESMATRQQQPRAAREQRVVLPTASKEEEFKFGTASSWTRDHLKLLGVEFSLKRRIDLNRVLKVRESEWPPELRESTTFFEYGINSC